MDGGRDCAPSNYGRNGVLPGSAGMEDRRSLAMIHPLWSNSHHTFVLPPAYVGWLRFDFILNPMDQAAGGDN